MTSFLEHLKTTIDKNETNLFLNDDFIKERKEANDKGFYFLIFDCGDLKYWSNSMVAFDDVDDSVITKKPFFKLKNAWYPMLVTGRPVIVLGMVTAPPEPMYLVTVIVPLLVT